MSEITLCPWAAKGPLDRAYHDEEWGRPLHDERRLFEMLILEGMQAGLSWSTVLNKREAFREAFDRFDPAVMAEYGQDKIAELMGNAAIIRNRRKIDAAIGNARAYFGLTARHGSLDAYLWGKVDGRPIVNHFARFEDVPVTTPLARAVSKELNDMGMKFVGPTIVYAYMQAVGIVDDHLTACPCHTENRADG